MREMEFHLVGITNDGNLVQVESECGLGCEKAGLDLIVSCT
jgi:hypothetical protein